MKLLDYMVTADENRKYFVIRGGKKVGMYDGKNSIPEKLNNKEIKRIEKFNHAICIVLK